jgi:TolB-like protein/Flp pilus assembly protein TadD
MGEESVKPASAPTGAVFLSYASQDAEAAKRICDALRAAGIEVWFDQSELRGGDAWDRRIREQIHDCRLFIPVISANSECRDEGYFRREWSLAADRTRDMAHKRAFLLPVVIDGTPERGASVPEKFHELQWTRLPGGDAPPAFVERIHRLLSPEGLPARAVATPVAPGSTVQSSRASGRPSWRFKPALWAISAALGLALAYFVAERFWLSKRTASAATVAGPASPAAAEKSIAVLPFVDLSEKHDQQYFADGIAEETLNQLAKIPGLKVIGRTSSFQFREKGDDVRKIGATLGAAFVLEGSVRKSADRVRVTAQLIGAGDGSHRWSETYDAKLDDVLKVQDDMAASLARALEVTVAVASTAERGSTSPEAYDFYLRGLHALDSESVEGCGQAVEMFKQALQFDAASARTLVSLAWAYDCIGRAGTGADFAQSRDFAMRALQVEPNSAEAHLVLASAHIVRDWDWNGAQREIDLAFKLAPPDGRALIIAARLAGAKADFKRATELLQQAQARDPLDPVTYDELAGLHLRSGRYTEAEAANRRCLQIDPRFAAEHYWLGIALLMQGRLQDALLETERETPRDGRFLGGAVVLYALHRIADSDAALKKAIEVNSSGWPSAIASVYAFRGERDQALAWLEKAYGARDVDLYFSKHDPRFRNLESDPRYKAFLRKMNLPE